MLSALISPEYHAEQVKLHACGYYGAYGDKWAPFVVALAGGLGASSILDYGCGQGQLGRRLRAVGVDARDFDPCVPAFAALPEPADLVLCADVLEHIEPDRLDAVLAHLASVTRGHLYAVIATRPATRTLSDGRNAHLTIKPAAWWIDRMRQAGWLPVPCPVENPVYDPALEVAGLWTAGGQS